MKRIWFLSFVIFIACQKEEDRCGTLIQKVNEGTIYTFVIQTDLNIRGYGDQNLPSIPDDGIRQGQVSKEDYEAFQLGDAYCADY